jgi:hypothetical protein
VGDDRIVAVRDNINNMTGCFADSRLLIRNALMLGIFDQGVASDGHHDEFAHFLVLSI